MSENELQPWYCQLSNEDGLAALCVSGADRVNFLNGQLTNDVSLLTPESTMLAGWCSNKGRLQTICQLIDWADAIWLVMPASVIESVRKKLSMYVLRADVQIELAEVTIIGLGDGGDEGANPEDKEVHSDENGVIAKVPGDPSRSIYIIPGLVDVVNEDIEEADSGYFWLRGIEAGVPRIMAETQEEFVAQQVNLDLLNGISFQKGCYIGQEIIARTQNLGTIKRRMYLFKAAADAPAVPGTRIIDADGKPAGQIVDAVSDGEAVSLLAVMSTGKLGGELKLEQDDNFTVSRSDLPYAIPESD